MEHSYMTKQINDIQLTVMHLKREAKEFGAKDTEFNNVEDKLEEAWEKLNQAWHMIHEIK